MTVIYAKICLEYCF